MGFVELTWLFRVQKKRKKRGGLLSYACCGLLKGIEGLLMTLPTRVTQLVRANTRKCGPNK